MLLLLKRRRGANGPAPEGVEEPPRLGGAGLGVGEWVGGWMVMAVGGG